MKLVPRRRSKPARAVEAGSDLAKLWAGTKVTKGTARGAGKAAKLRAVGGSKIGRRGKVAKAVAGRRSGRRAAAAALAGKAFTSSSTGRETGRKAVQLALGGKAAKGLAKRRRAKNRGRKLLVLGGVAAAVGAVLKARKDRSAQQPPSWTPSVPPAGDAPTDLVGAPPSDPATLREDAPNAGATGLTPEAVEKKEGRD